jgi:protein-disulfide isomerase
VKDLFKRNKVFILIVLATCFILVGGILLMSKGSINQSTQKVDSSILTPENTYKTSGLVAGAYLPASSSASVSLVEFGDYECPACGVYAPYVKQILSDNPGKVTYIFL